MINHCIGRRKTRPHHVSEYERLSPSRGITNALMMILILLLAVGFIALMLVGANDVANEICNQHWIPRQ
jgi:hypothetical protein